jgi:hypothetical protein
MPMNKERHACMDCKRPFPTLYMLKNEIWVTIVPGKKGVLCFGCAEKRLGRPILWDDLKPCGITNTMKLGIWVRRRTHGSKSQA